MAVAAEVGIESAPYVMTPSPDPTKMQWLDNYERYRRFCTETAAPIYITPVREDAGTVTPHSTQSFDAPSFPTPRSE